MNSELHLNTGFYQFTERQRETETERDRDRDKDRDRDREEPRRYVLLNSVQTVDSLQEVQYIILIVISDYHIKYKIS